MDYFNEFLGLLAFPVRVTYNRLTGNVQELDGLTTHPLAEDYGADDAQRDKTLQWLRDERLPLFRRSPLYLEYKLAKLLLHPLEDPPSGSRYGLHGYSRQSNSVTLSSFPSHPSSSYLPLGGSSVQPAYPGHRMPSRVHSSPAATGYFSQTYNLSLLKQYGDVIHQLYGPLDSDTPEGLLLPSPAAEEIFHVEEPDDQKNPNLMFINDITSGTEAFMNGNEGTDAFSSEVDDGFVTTEEEEQFLLQHNLSWTSLQHLKEKALGTREGMRSFTDFLRNTLGIHLFHFWTECEEFKEFSTDAESGRSPEESRDLCVHLFRRIQNKYQTSLSAECQEQIRLSQQNWGPTFQALRRSQYDALRRLRSYWLPRFILHQQSSRRARAGRGATQALANRKWMKLGHNGPETESEGKRRDPSEGWTPRPGAPAGSWDLMEKICTDPFLQNMLPALRSDGEAGGAFLHYLKRFESPQKSQVFLLWKELHGVSGWEAQDDGWSCQLHAESVPKPPVTERLSDLGTTSRMALAALCQPWIGFLQHDITMFLEYCVPALSQHESLGHEICGSGRHHKGQKRNKAEKGFGFSLPGGKTNLRKKTQRFDRPCDVSAGGLCGDPEVPLEMLQHRSIYKVYRSAVQDTEEPELLKALELLHALRDAKGDKKILGLVQKTLELNAFKKPSLIGLEKRLVNQLSKGTIDRSSLEETIRFLASLLAESFGRFWNEMSGWLKDYGVKETGNEGWVRLEPILKVISTKIILKRLHGRKPTTSHSIKTQPTAEDKASFIQAMLVASHGWPTPEVLHFLRHLQTYGPKKGLPLLHNNLLCYLEVQKYRNFHHPMPDRGFLKRKVQVITERFLWPMSNPELQLPPEILQRSAQEAETAEHSEIPSPSLLTPLQDSLRDSLLPFWAGFQKTWRTLSPNSTQRLPSRPVQQMLRRRLALFETDEASVKTFTLPPLQSRFPSVVTFNFSISHGVTVKENTVQGRDSQTPSAQDGRGTTHEEDLPPLNKTSANSTHAEGTKPNP